MPQLPPHHTVVTAAPSFYIHEDAVFDHTALTECVPGWALDDQSAEVAMLHQLRAHAARTLDPRLASLFVVPVYPYVSLLAGACAGTEHPARMAAAAAALSRSAWWSRRHGADHLLVTNTFRLGALGLLRPLLTNATVAWFEAPSAPRRGPGTLARLVSWRCTVVIPYLASPYCQQQRAARPTRSCPEAVGTEAAGGEAAGGEAAAAGGEAAAAARGEVAGAGGRGASLFFQGSLSTATRVRGHLAQLRSLPGARIVDVPRGGTQPNTSAPPGETCRRAEPCATKLEFARRMLCTSMSKLPSCWCHGLLARPSGNARLGCPMHSGPQRPYGVAVSPCQSRR